MDIIQTISLLGFGSLLGAGLFFFFSKFRKDGGISNSPLGLGKRVRPTEPSVKIDVKLEQDSHLGTKREEIKNEVDSAQIVKDKVKKIKDYLKLSIIVCFFSFSLESIDPLGRETEITPEMDEVLNYLDESAAFVELTGKEFKDLREDNRKDTKIKVLETTRNSKLVEFQVPVKEPVIRKLSETKIKAELKDSDPITRKVRISCISNDIEIEMGNRFWFGLNGGLLASIGANLSSAPQPGILLEGFHWSNDYMRISFGGFAGPYRYGVGTSFGPANYLSNLRIFIGYGREFVNQRANYVEIGIAVIGYVR
jgi:hypothetical protein